MSMISLGDLAQSHMLRRQNFAVKADLQRISTEVTTGQVVDSAVHLSGDLGILTGIDASLRRLGGYSAAATEAALFAEVMQTTLGVIDSLSVEFGHSAISATAGISDARVDTIGRDAQQKLATVMQALNTRVGDRSVFAGVDTAGPAVGGVETMLAALDLAIVGATSAADVETAVSAWFYAPSGYESTIYQGGAVLASLTVAAGEEADLGVTANNSAVRETLKGLTMAALLDRGALGGQSSARQDLALRAGTRLLQTASDRAALAAKVGTTQAQIDKAVVRNASENSALQMARNALVGVDPYEAASRLEQTQAQLEKIYAVTARMARLSLLDYM